MRRWLLLLVGVALTAQEPASKSVAPYYPTPMPIVRQMLEVGELKPDELHYDLGSGDGRFVLVAAGEFGARSVGFEIEEKLVNSSRQLIEEQGLSERASIRQQDLYTADFSEVDLITIYLLPRAMRNLRPLLEKSLKKGARVVAHDFYFEEWEPEETITVDYEVDDDGLMHSIYVYRR